VKTSTIYALIGLLVGGIVDVLLNLLAAAIQQHAFQNQFNEQSIWVLLVLTIVGSLVGYWLGGKIRVSPLVESNTPLPDAGGSSAITRLQALLSWIKLRGKGVHLSEILSIASKIDIDTRD
jgi:hypothetical protein